MYNVGIGGHAEEGPDPAHEATDRKIAALERRLVKLYSEAARPLQEQIRAFFKKFEDEDNKKRKRMEAGEITRDQYIQWRLSRIARGVEFAQLQDSVAEKLAEINGVADEQIGDDMPEVYALNYNQEREDAGADGLSALTAAAIAALIIRPKLDKKKDLRWNKRQVAASVTSGILLNKPLMGRNGICVDTLNFVIKRNTDTARVNARTWLTSAETNGRQALYDAAERLGISLEKTWYTQQDNLVRHEHAEMEGVTVPASESFIVDGYEMKGPGDRSAPGRLWYNCRCRMKCRRKRG